MRLIHLTARRFQYLTADSVYVSNLAVEFSKFLADDYLLIAGDKSPEQFTGINLINSRLSALGTGFLYFWLPYVYYFFWLPYFILTRKIKSSETVFFSSDANLLLILIFWKKFFRLKFKICSDWHMLYNNFKDSFIPRNSDCLVTTSEKLKKIIVGRSGINSGKIQVVYGGVDILSYQTALKSRLELGLPEDKKLVGYIGLFKTMGMEKGIKTMVGALKCLPTDIAMVFVGAKPGQSEEYKKYAEEKGVLDRCIFIDMRPAKIMPSYEKAMDILAIPYPDQPHFRNWGFPMKVYEYMASERPIIYSKLDLVEEVIGDCAVGFEADNEKDLADKILEVIGNNERAARMAESAYDKLSNFTWGKKGKNIIDFLMNE